MKKSLKNQSMISFGEEQHLKIFINCIIKSSLSYHFCKEDRELQSDYFDVNNYDYTGKKKKVVQAVFARFRHVVFAVDRNLLGISNESFAKSKFSFALIIEENHAVCYYNID